MVKRSLIALMTLCISLASVSGPGAAQEPSPTPADTGAIFAQEVALLLPVALRFSADVATTRTDLRSASLTVFQPEGVQEVYELDLEATVENLSVDTLRLTLTLLLDAVPLRPFEPVNYRWEVRTRGQVASEWLGEFVLEPRIRATWTEAGEAPITLHYAEPDLAAFTLLEDLQRAYTLLQNQAEAAPTVRLAIFGVEDALCQAEAETNRLHVINAPEFDCSPESYAAWLAEAGVLLVQRQSLDFTQLQDQLNAALVNAFYAERWASAAAIPAWFQAGLSMLYRPLPGGQELAIARAAQELNNAPALATPPAPQDVQRAIWEAQSYLMVLYLAERFGAQAPFELAEALTRRPDFDATLMALTNLPFSQLERDWRAWLRSPEAERAALWTPYLPTTPTPTATRTPSPRSSTTWRSARAKSASTCLSMTRMARPSRLRLSRQAQISARTSGARPSVPSSRIEQARVRSMSRRGRWPASAARHPRGGGPDGGGAR
ncbi:MAG: hypothetical protein HC915_10645, partial [Anaerolineae bacterium]|nr:hypothetical protein [Anaerolineae bacterium]